MKNKYLYIIILVTFVLLSSQCSLWPKPVPDDTLSIPKQNYFGSEIKIDGYWYEIFNPDGVNRYIIYFMYNNGVILGGDGIVENKLLSREEEFRNGEYYEYSFDDKYKWGRFIVDSSYIAIERWYPGWPPLPAYVRAGEILNDTTFVIKESYRMVDGQKTDIKDRNEVYHFKKFSPKPDSTNSFVP